MKTAKLAFFACILLLAGIPAAMAANCPKQPKTEAALLQNEHMWAEALEKHDAATVACLLADSFEDAGVDGSLSDREHVLAHIPHRRPGSNRLSEMKAHIFGDTGFVRGLNTVVDAQGNEVAKVRFTDIFIYRDGRWAAVAGQETLLKDSNK